MEYVFSYFKSITCRQHVYNFVLNPLLGEVLCVMIEDLDCQNDCLAVPRGLSVGHDS